MTWTTYVQLGLLMLEAGIIGTLWITEWKK